VTFLAPDPVHSAVLQSQEFRLLLLATVLPSLTFKWIPERAASRWARPGGFRFGRAGAGAVRHSRP